MNAAKSPHERIQQQQRPPQQRPIQQRLTQQQSQEVRGISHEPICIKETRVCWIEFGASIGCLVLGLILVFAGVSVDNSAVGAGGGSSSKPAGVQAVTYIGVILLIAGAILLVVFGVHFYRVKSRLDNVKAERFAQLGIRPVSRYEAVPESNLGPGAPRPPALPLSPRQQEQQQPLSQHLQSPAQLLPAEPPPAAMSSSRLQPMPSYREGAFYNLGFLADETDKSPPQLPPQSHQPPQHSTKPGGLSRGVERSNAPSAGAASSATGGATGGGVSFSRSYHAGLSVVGNQFLPSSSSSQDFQAKTVVSPAREGPPAHGRTRFGLTEPLETWQRPPEETPPPQRSPPPQYARDPFPLLHQPREQLRDQARLDEKLRDQHQNQSEFRDPPRFVDQPRDQSRLRDQSSDPRQELQNRGQLRTQQPPFRDQSRDQQPQYRDQSRDQQQQYRDQSRDQQLQYRDQSRDQQQFRDQSRDQQPKYRDQSRDQQQFRDQSRDQQQFRDQSRDQQPQFRDQYQPKVSSNQTGSQPQGREQSVLRDQPRSQAQFYNQPRDQRHQPQTRGPVAGDGGQSRQPSSAQPPHSTGYRSSQI